MRTTKSNAELNQSEFPLPTSEKWKPNLVVSTVTVYIVAAVGMGIYEYLKSYLFPQITSAESHTVTICLCASAAALGSYRIFTLDEHRNSDRVRREHEDRVAAEERLLQAHHTLEEKVSARTLEIRHTNAFLRSVIDTAPNLIFVKDGQGRFTLANRALADLYGTTVDDIVGKTDADLNDNSEEVDYFERIDREIIDNQSDMFIPEERVTDSHGNVHWLQTVKRALINDDGTSNQLLGIATDITEVKETVRALRDAESQYRSIFENASEGIFQTTPEGNYLRVNPELARIYGYDSPEDLIVNLIKIDSSLYVDPTRREVFVRTVVQDRSVTGFVSQVRRKDGSIIWISENARAALDANGKVLYFEGTVVDINDRRLAEDRVNALNDMLVASLLELQQAYDATIEGWSHFLDLRDKETEGHSRRVTELTVKLAQAFDLGEQKISEMRRGALLHDIGKMGIPDAILLKPGSLTEDEWKIMKLHPVYANELLSAIKFLQPSLEIPLCHHERWDGAGYPQGLTGDDIPISARLFAVVDVFDALTSDRPYRDGWPVDKVLSHIQTGSGTHFDPEVVDVFMRVIQEYLPHRDELRSAA